MTACKDTRFPKGGGEITHDAFMSVTPSFTLLAFTPRGPRLLPNRAPSAFTSRPFAPTPFAFLLGKAPLRRTSRPFAPDDPRLPSREGAFAAHFTAFCTRLNLPWLITPQSERCHGRSWLKSLRRERSKARNSVPFPGFYATKATQWQKTQRSELSAGGNGGKAPGVRSRMRLIRCISRDSVPRNPRRGRKPSEVSDRAH